MKIAGGENINDRTNDGRSGHYRDLRSLTPDKFDSVLRVALGLGNSILRLHAERFLKDSVENNWPAKDIHWLAAFDEYAVRFCMGVGSPRVREFVAENHELIAQAHQKYSSIEDLKPNLSSNAPDLVTHIERFGLSIRLSLLTMQLMTTPAVLLDPDWLQLAATPREFEAKLNQRLRTIKALMKAIYGVPSFRSPQNVGRDRQIWLLKKAEPHLTWGQIGKRFGVSDGAVELAYKRQLQRERSRLTNFQEIVAAVYLECEGKGEAMSLGFKLGALRLRHPSEEEPG